MKDAIHIFTGKSGKNNNRRLKHDNETGCINYAPKALKEENILIINKENITKLINSV